MLAVGAQAGGVKFAKSRQEIERPCRQLLGMRIVNNQTGSEGVVAHQLMLSAPVAIKKDTLSRGCDRQAAGHRYPDRLAGGWHGD